MKKRTLSLLLAVVCLFSLTAGLLSGCGGSKLQVSFDLNYDDAPEAPAAIQVKTGKAYGDLPVVTVQREGYTFAGWCLDADGEGELVTAETVVSKETDHTLYAKWEGLEYTVSFDLQGGNINGITTVESATVKVGNVYSMMAIPDDPERDNHTFLGWYYDAEGTQGPVTASTKVVKTCDHTLYAKWKENQLLYDFERLEDISAFNNRGNGLTFTAATFGDSNQLMIQNPNEGKSDNFLVMWAELKAGTRVTMDVTFTGELTDGARMHLFCYGANTVGDPITTGVINKALSDTHRKWYDGNGHRAMQENGAWFYGDENDWKEGNTVTVDFVVMEDCSGLSLWVNLGSNMEPAQWAQNAIYIDNIQFTPGYQEITEADMGGVEQKPQEQTEGEEEFPFTFECGSVDSDVFKLRDSNLNMSVAEKGGSQQLKLQLSTANGKNWLWLNKPLKAGTKVTFDVTFDNAGTGASMSVYGYGSKENGDPITIKPAGSNIDIQWYHGQGVSGRSGKKTVEVNIYENCYGVSLMLGFDGNPETVIYLDNFKLGKMSGSQQQTSGETNFPFTFECGSASSDVFKLRDSDLKMTVKSYNDSKQLVLQPTKANGKYWLWLNKELKAGYKVTLDVTFDRGEAGGDMSIFAYGSKSNGDPITEGTPTETIPQSWFWGQGVNADFSAGNTNKQTITVTVYQPCNGISLMLGMETGTSVYIDNITLDTSGEIEGEPSEPTEPEETEPPAPGGETDFPFTFEVDTYSPDVLDARNSGLNMSVVDYDGSKQLKIGYISTNNWLWLHKELKAGTTITFDVTFDNANTGDAMSIYCYGSKTNGDPITEGTPTDTIPQSWYWGQGVNADFSAGNTNKQTVTFTVYEDCCGMSMMLGFGDANKTQTAIYLDNIALSEAGNEPPEPTEPEETEPQPSEPEETEPVGQTDFPFTFDDASVPEEVFKLRDSDLEMTVAEQDGSQQLRLQPTAANGKYWLWLNKELKAGTVITMDVTFQRKLGTMNLYLYGSKANGDPITEGTPTDTIPQSWFWGQGVDADFTAGNTNTQTLTFTAYEDCYGISFMLGFGNKKPNVIFIDNIQIVQQGDGETTQPEETEPVTAETEPPFTFEGGSFSADVFDKRNSQLDMSVVDYDGSKQLKVSYISTNNWLWLHKNLKAGTTVTFDVTFDNAGTGDAMSIFCYGSKANGDPVTEGTPTDTIPQSWFWGQGVSAELDADGKKKYTVTFTVYEDCCGMSMMIGFGDANKTSTSIYLDNIVITEP